MALDSFVNLHLDLLELERNEELEASKLLLTSSPKSLEEKGLSIRKLSLENICSGLFGDTVFEFSLVNPTGIFPSNSLSSGDIIGIYEETSGANWNQCLVSGVLLKIGTRDVSVAVAENTDQSQIENTNGGRFRLVKLSSDITYKRIKIALQRLQKPSQSAGAFLIDVLFGQAEISVPGDAGAISFFNTGLDDSQRSAVEFCLSQRELAIVHGPPGTGKTTTVVEVVRQAVYQRSCKVLVTAPSNMAVDNLIERLALPLPHRLDAPTPPNASPRFIRLGHPARAMSHLQRFTLDARLASCDQRELIQEVRQELNDLFRGRKGGREAVRREATTLRKELKSREGKAMKEIFDSAQVVFSTLTSLWTDKAILNNIDFDIVVIDECSQAIEAACWLAIPRGKKLILAGDHKQLPPTVISKEAADKGLAVSLMERILDSLPADRVTRMLTTQYRMHQDIMNWSSDTFYQGRLQAHESVATHLLSDLTTTVESDNGMEDEEILSLFLSPLVLIDTSGCDLFELEVDQEMSKGNLGEADLVACHVSSLLTGGISADVIGVITPYNLQVELCRSRLNTLASSSSSKSPISTADKVEVRSVDGFQGREKEAIIISLVRSNKKREVGFLSEHRRLNVAVTRARRHLCVIGDVGTVGGGKDAILTSFVSYLNKTADIRSAQEYINKYSVGCEPVPQDLVSKTERFTGDNTSSKKAKSKNQSKSSNAQPSPKSTNQTKAQEADQGRENRHNFKANQKSATGSEMSEAEIEERRHYEKILTDFMASEKALKEEEFHFPETLNPRERAIVHELADSLKLVHISVGEGKDRHLTVKLSPEQLKSRQDQEEVSASEESGDEEGLSDSEALENGTRQEPINRESLFKKSNQMVQQPQPSNQSKKKKKKATVEKPLIPKEPTTSKIKPNPIESVDPYDFDALLAAAAKLDSVCRMTGCKTLVRTLGMDCRCCSLRFCLAHHQAEIHGCGDALKAAARTQLIREGVVRPGSGAYNHLPDPTRRRHLERRLEKKVTAMEDKRASDSAKTKKKK